MNSPKTPEKVEVIPSASIIVGEYVEVATDTSDMVLSTPCRVEDPNLKRIKEVMQILNNGSPSATARLRLKKQLEELKSGKNQVPNLYRDEIDIITTQEREYRPLESIKEIFAGQILFVDIRTGGDNRSEGVKKKLREDGVQVTDEVEEATVCIFSNGLKTVYDKAKLHNIPLCTLMWIEKCKEHKRIVDYKDHLVPYLERYENPELFKQRRRKSMQPNGSVFVLKKKPLKKKRIKLSKPRILILTPPGNETRTTPVSIDVCVKAHAMITNRNGTQIFDSDFMEASAHCEFNNNSGRQSIHREPSIQSLSSSDMLETPIRTRPNVQENVDLDILDKTIRPQRIQPINIENLPLQPLQSTLINPENDVNPLFDCTNSNNQDSLLRRSLENKKKLEEEKKAIEQRISQEENEFEIKKPRPKKRRLFNPNDTAQSSVVQTVEQVEITSINGEQVPATSTNHAVHSEREVENLPNATNVETPKVKISKKQPKKQPRSVKMSDKTKQQPKQITRSLPKKRIAYSCLTHESQLLLRQVVNELKGCHIDSKVTERTTHLIIQKPYSRTEKVLLAVVYGIWVLDFQYIIESQKSKNWLWEEMFEIRDYIPAICISRADKQILGKEYRLKLLKGKNIYVDPDMTGDAKGLERFVTLLGGCLVVQERAGYIICEKVPPNKAVNQICIAAKWVTDSICEAFLKDEREYIVQ